MSRLSYLAALLVLALPTKTHAHSGGLDSNGGHMDHRTGSYHIHGGGTGGGGGISAFAPVNPMAMRNAAAISRLAIASRAARQAARTSPRTTARAPKVYTKAEPEYLFHHTKLSPYEVASFVDDGEAWKTLLSKGIEVRLPKETIIRIEPLKDPRALRTWFDASGKYSVVAKYVDFADPKLRLQEMNGVVHELQVEQLSSYDQEHLHHKILDPENKP